MNSVPRMLVWDMFASRMLPLTSLNAATVITAMGIDVEIVSPARRPR
jgi:hypothetical protein